MVSCIRYMYNIGLIISVYTSADPFVEKNRIPKPKSKNKLISFIFEKITELVSSPIGAHIHEQHRPMLLRE